MTEAATRASALDRAAIAELIPHAGAMCLIDQVLDWGDGFILCRTASHRASDNPLRAEKRLAAICGVEYASQAMAIHGRLAGAVAGRPRAGYLASLRDVVLHVARLDTLAGDLDIEAAPLIGEGDRVVYRFALRCGGTEVLSGRAAVFLQAVPS